MADPARLEEATRLHAEGRLEDAETAYRTLLAGDPRNPDLLHLYGVLIGQMGNLQEAVRLIDEAIAIRPEEPSYRWNLAVAAGAAGDPGAALHIYLDLGNLHLRAGRLEDALAAYDRGLDIDPANPQLCTNAGVALGRQGRWDKAIQWFDRALEAQPDFSPARTNRGNALWGKGAWEAALADYRYAMELDPENASAQLNLAFAFYGVGRSADALPHYRRAIALNPDFARAHYDLGLLLLRQGNIAEGFRELEWRWHPDYAYEVAQRAYAQPVWKGEGPATLRGPILVIPEQGFGDIMLLARFVPRLAAEGHAVVFETGEKLFRLFRQSFAGQPRITVTASPPEARLPSALGRLFGARPAFSAFVGLFSLPSRLEGTAAGIPPAPYLKVDDDLKQAWKRRVEAVAGRGLRVGFVWSGLQKGPCERRVGPERDVMPKEFAPLAAMPGVIAFSLQKEAETAPEECGLHSFMHEVVDFADTAALIEALDLVISVDTAVANLAGALGKPVWLLDRVGGDWRWGEGGDASPWYPSARVFHQRVRGDWKPVLDEIAEALKGLTTQRG